jgi:hypothetical protein
MRKLVTAAVAAAVLLGASGTAVGSAPATSDLATHVKAVQMDPRLNEFLGDPAVVSQVPVATVETSAGSELRFRAVDTHGIAPELRASADRWNQMVTDSRFEAAAATASRDSRVVAAQQAALDVTAGLSPTNCINTASSILLALPVFLIVVQGKVLTCTGGSLPPGALVNCGLGIASFVVSNRIAVLQNLVTACAGPRRDDLPTQSPATASGTPIS